MDIWEIEKDITLFRIRVGKFRIKLYHPWVLKFWNCTFAKWEDDILYSWFVDIGPLQIRYMSWR
jgi:hypothetical protein